VLKGVSSTVVGTPSQGTVLIDLAVDDPEFISISDQVGLAFYSITQLFLLHKESE
jgi:hypothetical protein